MDIFEQPRALLIGDKGQIGWELLRSLAPIVRLDSVDYPCLDLSDGSAIQRYICRIAPDVIVNAAAYTNVKQAEDEPEEAKKINEIAPGVIAKEAKKLGALLVHYSTDFIFDGEKRQPYVEDDIPNPLNVYGQTKLGGDRAIQETGCRHLIFRTCWVYGIRGSNFMLTMLNLANNNEHLKGVTDQVGTPTWCRLIADATALAVSLALRSQEDFSGIYNLSASGETSRYGFAQAIFAQASGGIFNDRLVEPILSSEFSDPTRRPSYSVLCCDKLYRTFGLRLPSWEANLAMALDHPNIK